MNISQQILIMAAKIAEKIAEEGAEVGPSLASALRYCQENIDSALANIPTARGWDLGGISTEMLFKQGPFGVRWGIHLYSDKGEYIVVKDGKYLITATFGDMEIERGLASFKEIKPISNKKALELWSEIENEENEE